MSLQNTDLFVVQRGNLLYKVAADQVASDRKITTVDVETIGVRPSSVEINPFEPTQEDLPTQNSVNWYLYDRTFETSNVSVSVNPPNSPAEGDLWWTPMEGNLFIWYDDGDSAQWVDASPAFIDIDYTRIEYYIDQSVQDNAVSQISGTGIITVDPADGKGSVTIGADTSGIYDTIELLDDKFTVDQQRQDDFLAQDQQRQDDEIARLESIIRDLADRLDQLEDEVANRQTIDGGYPNAQGIFDEDDTDAGAADPASMTGTPIDGGDAEDLLN